METKVKSVDEDNEFNETFFRLLDDESQLFLKELRNSYQFTFQEFKQLCETSRDLTMWHEKSFASWWLIVESIVPQHLKGPQRKKLLIQELKRQITDLKAEPTHYLGKSPRPRRAPLTITTQESDKRVLGNCPVASEKTVCCNLKTIDAVENCAFGCSYCTIQTFYGDRIVFDKNFKDKLNKLVLDPGRFYHIGTGQSSDSLVWGNRDGILDQLCQFAAAHPNILLEFKTKSDNVSYFLEHDVPRNIVCSWSLNPQTIIDHEEHFTASLNRRLSAARKVADRGIKVAFHFHPIVYYEGWSHEYPLLASYVQKEFHSEEVLFISLGSITFIKPVIQQIRKRGEPTKILQMEMVPDPHGKLTYPDQVKEMLFKTVYDAFEPWHEKVFFYLCMERAHFWDRLFGWHYPTNEEFELDFGTKIMEKISLTGHALLSDVQE